MIIRRELRALGKNVIYVVFGEQHVAVRGAGGESLRVRGAAGGP